MLLLKINYNFQLFSNKKRILQISITFFFFCSKPCINPKDKHSSKNDSLLNQKDASDELKKMTQTNNFKSTKQNKNRVNFLQKILKINRNENETETEAEREKLNISPEEVANTQQNTLITNTNETLNRNKISLKEFINTRIIKNAKPPNTTARISSVEIDELLKPSPPLPKVKFDDDGDFSKEPYDGNIQSNGKF